MMNVELANRVKQYIEDNPNYHDQGVWVEKSACGTRSCIAGTTVMLAGYRLIWQKEYVKTPINNVETNDIVHATFCIDPHGKRSTISDAASALLGLSVWEAESLFYSSRDKVLDILGDMIEKAEAQPSKTE